VNLTLVSEIPSFLTDQLGFDIRSAGLLGILPFFALFLGSLCFGLFFEHCQQVRGWKVRTVRQVAEYMAFGVSSLVLIVCGFMTDPYIAYSLVILTEVTLFVFFVLLLISFSYYFSSFVGHQLPELSVLILILLQIILEY
jgi:hypothetical protein